MTATAFWLAGRQATGETTFDVTNPWDGRLVGQVSVPGEDQGGAHKGGGDQSGGRVAVFQDFEGQRTAGHGRSP